MTTQLDMSREIAEQLFAWNYDYGEPIPDYSENIEYAWLVVEHMRRRGYHFALHVFSDGCIYAIFHYGKFGDGDLDERGTALTASTPEAICRAALEALKNDNP